MHEIFLNSSIFRGKIGIGKVTRLVWSPDMESKAVLNTDSNHRDVPVLIHSLQSAYVVSFILCVHQIRFA
jgi:hypothetical protein